MSSSYLRCHSGWVETWSLCGRVVYIIVAQVHGTKCQMLLMWRPARMFRSAHEPELTLSAQQDSGKKTITQRRDICLQRRWSNSAFYNRCSELINWNWRSCQLKEIGWCKSGHLWLLPHLQLRRVLIRLDADNQVHISFGRGACVHLIYALHPRYLFLSAPFTNWNNGKSHYGMSHQSPWWVSCCSISPLISNLIPFSHRIHRGAPGSISTTTRCQVLRQGG